MKEQNENFWDLDKQIIKAKQEVDHWGTVSTRGKTDKEIAHIDEQFFLANKNLKELKQRRTDLASKRNAKTSVST
ncbi:hypothetical protein [Acinetobacter dispersus]|uniref:Uncharacterized protein n=1 Tax=Acinetobacter dispersus TaxID=70348 RepID=N9LAU1_9GAMM|nr:hypothetical protein [Acinetobacter dispersus]ENW93387.1 hypothetical protein F904_01443 [Acinetobacter dispersus]